MGELVATLLHPSTTRCSSPNLKMNIKQTTKTFIQGRQDCVPPSQFPKVSEGAWQAPEDLVSFGLQQSRVLMMNENHDGPAHCPRTRRVGLSVLPAAHRAGCRILAMEAISEEEAERFNQTRKVENAGNYLTSADLAAMAQSALDLGWQLAAYDSTGHPTYTEREMAQARALTELVSELEPSEKMMVWAGNCHPMEVELNNGRKYMGAYFKEMSGIDPFTIDQGETTIFPGDCPSLDWKNYQSELAPFGGTAGFLGKDATGSLSDGAYDAFIFSSDNDFVG